MLFFVPFREGVVGGCGLCELCLFFDKCVIVPPNSCWTTGSVCVCFVKGLSVGRSVTTRLKGSVSWQSESVSIGHSSGSSGGQETI